ncbi:MAG: hypothetical protein CSA60_01875 [Neptuniibacter caesariensis]|uniref:Probable membrane transporter protein n=1 Tax=Neptuniibacter caesariensis TaxID=207954 RepID=A0A2G6JRC3_NEPCE|nr:MAG: hypothetical protein CSA60_01875 [Neptuniibacter caesariensis]
MELELSILLVLMITGFTAGLIDAIAGGGGMVALPVLLSCGLSPVEALATNKLQSSFGTFSAARYFIKRKLVDLRQMKVQILCTFSGAAAGTLLIQRLDSSLLDRLMPILLIVIALYFALSSGINDEEKKERLSATGFGVLIGTSIGFYDGFFGPGTGTFFTLAYVTLAGYGMAKATAHTKVLNLTSNIAALIFFTVSGHVVWLAGSVMAIGQLIGGRLGATLVISKGTKLIRPLVIIMTLLLSLKLLFS